MVLRETGLVGQPVNLQIGRAKLGFVATCNSEGADNGNGNKWTAVDCRPAGLSPRLAAKKTCAPIGCGICRARRTNIALFVRHVARSEEAWRVPGVAGRPGNVA